ncbi:hypothetical protein BD779DRAFT_1602047 [Infundibulicybe gibba]|nr:hypothetical protein BD779DRAFT_1602047 [Infundibulicybe gibba]
MSSYQIRHWPEQITTGLGGQRGCIGGEVEGKAWTRRGNAQARDILVWAGKVIWCD